MDLIVYYLLGILLVPGIIYASIVQAKVNSTFQKYAVVANSKNLTAKEVCQKILQWAGITDVEIQHISGDLTDNYDPKTKKLSLSDKVYNSTSISALGVAAHEAGHAIQDAENYFFIKIRHGLIVFNNICSKLLWPMVIVGLILSAFTYTSIGSIFIVIGLIFFGMTFLISLTTLPVEFNASKRALSCLVETGTLDQTEVKGAKAVLSAAAQTYVASLIIAILSMLRFLLAIFITKENN